MIFLYTKLKRFFITFLKINDIKLKERLKRWVKLKSISGICAVCITSTMLLGINIQVYASDVPNMGTISSIFKDKTYENYDKYASDVNITKESNGWISYK